MTVQTGLSPDIELVVESFFEYLLGQFEPDTFKTTGRRRPHWSEVKAQPGLFVSHPYDDDKWSGDGLQITQILLDIIIYLKTESPVGVPDTNLTTKVKVVRDLLQGPVTGGNLQLKDSERGLVYRCRIEGRSIYATGDGGKQAVAMIPVVLTITP
jgi:hypothetical protein